MRPEEPRWVRALWDTSATPRQSMLPFLLAQVVLLSSNVKRVLYWLTSALRVHRNRRGNTYALCMLYNVQGALGVKQHRRVDGKENSYEKVGH